MLIIIIKTFIFMEILFAAKLLVEELMRIGSTKEERVAMKRRYLRIKTKQLIMSDRAAI